MVPAEGSDGRVRNSNTVTGNSKVRRHSKFNKLQSYPSKMVFLSQPSIRFTYRRCPREQILPEKQQFQYTRPVSINFRLKIHCFLLAHQLFSFQLVRLELQKKRSGLEGLLDLRKLPHTWSNHFTTPNSGPSNSFDHMGDFNFGMAQMAFY